MGRKGDVWDRAVAGSFSHLLKSELGHHAVWDCHDDAHRDLSGYLEVRCNRERLDATLGYLSPAQFERRPHRLAA